MNIQILEEAERELAEAIEHYEKIEIGLGLRLKKDVRNALQWIRKHPDVPHLRPKGYRRVNLKIFRFYIAYFIWTETI